MVERHQQSSDINEDLGVQAHAGHHHHRHHGHDQASIDTNLYSRQIGTYGLETMGKLIKMHVLIVGLRGLGVEVAKNLILAGPASVTLYDPEPVQINDLSANFYVSEQDVANRVHRSHACHAKLQELNPYVKV